MEMDFGGQVVGDRSRFVIKSENDVREMHLAKRRVSLASFVVRKI